MLTPEQKNAIENLLILVDYIKDNSIYTDDDGKIIDNSIRIAEELIGKRKGDSSKEEGLKTETAKFLAEEIKKRFNS